MENSYCGNDCSECLAREEVGCPGCKVGPGRAHDNMCEIARCCSGKSKAACASCDLNGCCNLLSGRQHMFQKWQKKVTPAKVERIVSVNKGTTGSAMTSRCDDDDAKRLRRGLLVIFFMFIPVVLSNYLLNETYFWNVLHITIMGWTFRIGGNLVRVIMLLYMGRVDDDYKRAGFFYFLAYGFYLLLEVYSRVEFVNLEVMLMIMVVCIILEGIGVYRFYTANAYVVGARDGSLATRWQVMVKVYFVVLALSIVESISLIYFPVFGLIFTIVMAVILLIYNICEHIFLLQTAFRFRKNY